MERTIRTLYSRSRESDRSKVVDWMEYQKRQLRAATPHQLTHPKQRPNPLAEEESVKMDETHAD